METVFAVTTDVIHCSALLRELFLGTGACSSSKKSIVSLLKASLSNMGSMLVYPTFKPYNDLIMVTGLSFLVIKPFLSDMISMQVSTRTTCSVMFLVVK